MMEQEDREVTTRRNASLFGQISTEFKKHTSPLPRQKKLTSDMSDLPIDPRTEASEVTVERILTKLMPTRAPSTLSRTFLNNPDSPPPLASPPSRDLEAWDRLPPSPSLTERDLPEVVPHLWSSGASSAPPDQQDGGRMSPRPTDLS